MGQCSREGAWDWGQVQQLLRRRHGDASPGVWVYACDSTDSILVCRLPLLVLPPQVLRLQDGGAVPYDKLCICTGSGCRSE